MPLGQVNDDRRNQGCGRSPFVDHVDDVSGFVNPTVIDHDNRLGSGEHVHLVQ